MTKAEATEILQRHHICTIHFCQMRPEIAEDTLGHTMKYYACPACTDAPIVEAIRTLQAQ